MKFGIYSETAKYPAMVLLVLLSFSLSFAADIPESTVGNSLTNEAAVGDYENGQVRGKWSKTGFKDQKKLGEIVERAIQAAGETDGGKSANLDLPVKGVVTSKVGLRHDPIDGGLRRHNGIDIAIPEGTAVLPVAPGKVLYSGQQHGYGNMVIIRHNDGMITIYAHHSSNCVKTGDKVDRKTTIAYSGSTGRSTGPHLHFEAWQGGKNVTEAFLPNFAGRCISDGSDASLEKTNLRKVIMSDGTILFIDVSRVKN
ncbi:MAG TPA: M23 family metallopeptidase [Geobacteraceae bacterium]|nr:M23 family metallopeptidase [Geobacteraceae bacterium]